MDTYFFHSKSSPLRRYIFAVSIFLIALTLRFLLLPIEYDFAFITFYPATLVSFYLCGRGPGAMVAILSVMAANFFFMPPYFGFSYGPYQIMAVVIFLMAAYLISQIIKQLQNALISLEKSKQHYLSILEDQTEFLCRFQTDGTILYVNDAFCRLFSRPRETLIGKKWQPIAFSEDLPLIHEKLSSLSPANPVVMIENRFMTPGKGLRWGQFVNRGIFDKTGQLIELQAVGRDITEQKQTQEKLAAVTQELQDLYDNAPCGYHSLSPDGTFLRMNATELAWLGRQREEVVGKMKFTDVITPSGKALFKESYPKYLKKGQIENLNFDLVGKDGMTKPINVSATSLKDADGHFIMSRSVMFDITELKKSEQAIRDSENKFSKIFHHNPMGIGIYRTVDNRFIDVNEAFLHIYGFSREEIFDHTALELGLWIDIDYRDKAKLKNRLRNIEVMYQRQIGEKPLTLLASLEPIELEDEPCLIAMILDITDRKQTEQQLHKLATAVDQSLESIMITNLNAEIEYVNEAFLRTSGYSRQEVLGQNPRFLQSGKTSKKTYLELWEALTHGRCWTGEMVNQRKDGSDMVEFSKISPVFDTHKTITHYVEAKEDITDRKRLALELDQHRSHLEALVTRRTAELETALSLADAANQAKSAFLANMSHEIRTPMNAIVGLTYLLQKTTLTAEQLRKLQQIEKSSQHLMSIINDILDLSKIEASQMQLEQTDFSLEALLDHIRSLIIHQAQTKGITIEINRNGIPRWLRGDSNRLRQALLNYAGNALKFTEKGSICLRAKLLEESETGLLIRFEVQDTGIGIPEAKLPMLFETFSQVDVSTTRQYGGTGLGLSITRRLANLMGGATGVESVPGQGSLFWFTARLQRGHGILPNVSP